MAMTFGTSGPAARALYPIIDVAGRHPDMLTDFIGDVTVTMAIDGRPCRLTGIGGLTDRGMEFQQKDGADADDGVVRMWAITQASDETFWAEPLTSWSTNTDDQRLLKTPPQPSPASLNEARHISGSAGGGPTRIRRRHLP